MAKYESQKRLCAILVIVHSWAQVNVQCLKYPCARAHNIFRERWVQLCTFIYVGDKGKFILPLENMRGDSPNLGFPYFFFFFGGGGSQENHQVYSSLKSKKKGVFLFLFVDPSGTDLILVFHWHFENCCELFACLRITEATFILNTVLLGRGEYFCQNSCRQIFSQNSKLRSGRARAALLPHCIGSPTWPPTNCWPFKTHIWLSQEWHWVVVSHIGNVT